MSGYDYKQIAKTAQRLITRFGMTNSIRRTTSTQGNPWDTPTFSEADYPCEAVITRYSERQIDGINILAGDRKATVAAEGLSVVPLATDKFISDGVTYTIVSIGLVKPADVVISYVLQVRTA